MNGKGKPTTGKSPIVILMFIIVWATKTDKIPDIYKEV